MVFKTAKILFGFSSLGFLLSACGGDAGLLDQRAGQATIELSGFYILESIDDQPVAGDSALIYVISSTEMTGGVDCSGAAYVQADLDSSSLALVDLSDPQCSVSFLEDDLQIQLANSLVEDSTFEVQSSGALMIKNSLGDLKFGSISRD